MVALPAHPWRVTLYNSGPETAAASMGMIQRSKGKDTQGYG